MENENNLNSKYEKNKRIKYIAIENEHLKYGDKGRIIGINNRDEIYIVWDNGNKTTLNINDDSFVIENDDLYIIEDDDLPF